MTIARCIHDLVQEQANSTPGATALRSGQVELTYRDLDVRSNQIANLLRSAGAGLEVPVGVCMNRSADFVLAVLGILKAGGAYVPIDPSYPANRISMLLQESAVSLVLTHSAVASKMPGGAWKAIVIDEEDLSSVRGDDTPTAIAQLHNLAYIIYTSGSTGRPKGVEVTHGNLLNLVAWHQRAFNLTSADRGTLHASPGFDASVWELWPYLASGASLHVVDDSVRATPDALRDWLVAHKITIGFFPTALAECMIASQWPPESQLRLLLTGADMLRRRPAKYLPFKLVNNYGPTECCVVATSGTVQSEEVGELPSIGRAIDGVKIYIVDDQLHAISEGTSGELLIGGAGVARGYRNAPELTKQQFLSDPFSDIPGARVYRTGDLGRYLPGGQIAFLGRIDEQIKIMGYRIEPGEITVALNCHEGIRDSFVTGISDLSGNKRLVAYVIPSASERLSYGDLRNFLRNELPDYMVPTIFVVVASLPYSSHGKIDRSALPQPNASNILADDSFEQPQSPIEQHLAAFLSALLKIDRVGRDDNFFTLGGHSLLGAQLIARIQQSFGVELPLRRLFEEPTIKEMAAEIERLIYAKVSAMSEDEAQQILASSENSI